MARPPNRCRASVRCAPASVAQNPELRNTVGMRRLLAFLVCLPVSVMGILIAHQAGYTLLASDAQARAELLARTGHGYLGHLPIVVATLVALTLGSLVADVIGARRIRSTVPVRAWHFAAFAPVGFVLQEYLERIVFSGAVPLDAWHQPTMVVGVLMQLPVALFSWLLALALLRVAPRIQVAIASPPRPRPTVSRADVLWVCCQVARVQRPLLAAGAAGRAPPPASV